MTFQQRETCAALIASIRARTLYGAATLACGDLRTLTCQQVHAHLHAIGLMLEQEQQATAVFEAYLTGTDGPEAGQAAIAQLCFINDHLAAFESDAPQGAKTQEEGVSEPKKER
ncbi:MAG TPA: hypothetical protein VE258_11875 [Ktedonobacterales bacterium]|nr:hypothetical protein [Ktedonobacterales bacterium]